MKIFYDVFIKCYSSTLHKSTIGQQNYEIYRTYFRVNLQTQRQKNSHTYGSLSVCILSNSSMIHSVLLGFLECLLKKSPKVLLGTSCFVKNSADNDAIFLLAAVPHSCRNWKRCNQETCESNFNFSTRWGHLQWQRYMGKSKEVFILVIQICSNNLSIVLVCLCMWIVTCNLYLLYVKI